MLFINVFGGMGGGGFIQDVYRYAIAKTKVRVVVFYANAGVFCQLEMRSICMPLSLKNTDINQ